MAKKSKTQRAKASAARQQRKATREEVAEQPAAEVVEAEEKPKKSLFKKSDTTDSDDEAAKKPAKKAEDKPAKKKRFQFLRDVKAEMKRVTWPTRVDVLRWSGVVIVALLFFGIFVAVLDNLIITPLLVAVSGL